MPQSPELAAGEGFTFEGNVAAFYLSAVLAQGSAPGIQNSVVTCVSLQQHDFGDKLDDVIVDFETFDKKPGRLSLQAKIPLTISAANSNSNFRDVIRGSWQTFKKANFRHNVDRYGAAVSEISSAKLRDLNTLCALAKESATNSHFEARFSAGGNASTSVATIKTDIEILIREANGEACTVQALQQFLAHFVVIQFDLHADNGTNTSQAINLIRNSLASEAAEKAPLVWSKLVQLARHSAGRAGQLDRPRLVREVATVAKLRGAASFESDLRLLSNLAQSYADQISDDIGGVRLERAQLVGDLEKHLTSDRLVQVVGLPGTGKSVVIKHAVERALKNGPVLFLKSDRLEGAGWVSYANANGLSTAPLAELLVEIGAVGTPVLFIDGIDRIEQRHQAITLDVLRTIVESPQLENWKVVVSLRDTGIEGLRNWLSNILSALPPVTLTVGSLNDIEAEKLTEELPQLRPLLFGTPSVKDVVRRPFFAKILIQSGAFGGEQSQFEPTSEFDLIKHWWQRGGFDAHGQTRIYRQQTLIQLARAKSKDLSNPIRISDLNVQTQIDALKLDGIIQDSRPGLTVNFSHDIFFEWSYFYVLADSGNAWLTEIQNSGEPPALARVLELSSQWALAKDTDWSPRLRQVETSQVRSQYLRAWLLGPLGIVQFIKFDRVFSQTVFADDFRLFRKLLVWFQAEKTTPNLTVLNSDYPTEKRQRLADLHGLPTDYPAWMNLIAFILKHISIIPHKLYPEIVTVFEVWQNAGADQRNPISHALLSQCAAWLTELSETSDSEILKQQSDDWKSISDLPAFKTSLVQIILRASRSEPSLTEQYLQRVSHSGRILKETFQTILNYSFLLSQTHSAHLVAVSLAYLLKPLPYAQLEQEAQDLQRNIEWHTALKNKPLSERTKQDTILLEMSAAPQLSHEFSDFDWERLCINDDHGSYWPTSPLREPFHSLFQHNPQQALELINGLCNHAVAAWRQLHRYSPAYTSPYSYRRIGKPLPLTLAFPWGSQQFWGNTQEYEWFRSTQAPKAIACGLMALEEWCFAELERGLPLDTVIQTIVQGNECIAVLGVAAALLLHSKTVSETTLPFVTSQRLLTADSNRCASDIAFSSANLIGFNYSKDKAHIEAVQKSNARPVRHAQLDAIVPLFILSQNTIGDKTRERILAFKDNLPYAFEEDRSVTNVNKKLSAEALKHAELAVLENYRTYKPPENPEQLQVVHVSPSALNQKNNSKAHEASNYLKVSSLWMWALQSFEAGKIQGNWTVADALAFARTVEIKDASTSDSDDELGLQHSIRHAGVTATAALALYFRDKRTDEELTWARHVVLSAAEIPELLGAMQSPSSHSPWHHAGFAARGLAADIRENTISQNTVQALLGLVAHPIEDVAELAFNEVCQLWDINPKLAWTGLFLALKLCHIQKNQYNDANHTPTELKNAVDEVMDFYKGDNRFIALPLPPPAYTRVDVTAPVGLNQRRARRSHRGNIPTNAPLPEDEWCEPTGYWHSTQASKILNCLPLHNIIHSAAKDEFLDFLCSALNWTNLKNSPPWAKAGERIDSGENLYTWNRALGATLGRIAGLMPLKDFQTKFLDPILKQEGDSCWALLEPFTDTYVRAYIYDAPKMPVGAIATLELCLERLLKAKVFERSSYRDGELYGYHLPELARTLMFVSVEYAELASRYANGDWSSINHILPIVNRFVRACGWSASVMSLFLTLCERAKTVYPAQCFADQVLSIIRADSRSLKGWGDTFNLARIAELVHGFSQRESPMPHELAQKFLEILDLLVDMGDRRSAALQMGQAFREVRLPML
jgi:hypothetical protein